MNRIGPLVEHLTATIGDDGLVTVTARPPGPAGLALATIGGGEVTIEVDVAEPANLVGLRYPARPVDPGAVDRVLSILFDRPVAAALRDLVGRADAGGSTVVWEADPLTPDGDDRSARNRSGRTGELGRIGHLALITVELTRFERSQLGTALALADLAELSQTLTKDLQPIPDADRLTSAALGHLRRWARPEPGGDAVRPSDPDGPPGSAADGGDGADGADGADGEAPGPRPVGRAAPSAQRGPRDRTPHPSASGPLSNGGPRQDAPWGRNQGVGPGGGVDDWLSQVAPRHREVLIDQVGRLARMLRLQDPGVAELLHQVATHLRRHGPGRAHDGRIAVARPGAFAPGISSLEVMESSALLLPPDQALEPMASPLSRSRSATDGRPITVVVDPALPHVDSADAEVNDGHLHITGTGSVDTEAWVRVFVADTPPTLVAMAPLTVTAIGRWRARALLPGGVSTGRLLVDLTGTPKDPWRSAVLRAATAAVDLGAQAAPATRRADPDAAHRWDATASAWDAAGDDHQATTARRLAQAVDDGATLRPARRPTLDEGPHIVDVVG